MGVRGFLSYVKKKVPLIDPLETEEGLRIGIDAHGLLYTWQENVQAIHSFVRDFQAKHTLIFVFDGEAPAEKKELLREKRQTREKAGLQAHALSQFLETEEGKKLDPKSRQHLEKQIQMLRASTWRITKEYRERVIQILENYGVPILYAKGEADEELVLLERKKEIDVILTYDMDYIRFGVNRMWIPKIRSDRTEVYDFDIPIFCEDEDITIESLADVAILCGSEYEYSPISPLQAISFMRYYGSLKNLAQRRPEFQKYGQFMQKL